MSKYYAYIRVSTDKQTLENQKHKILEFAFNKKIQIEDFIEVEVSSKKNQKERLIDDLFLKLEENDRLSLHNGTKCAMVLKYSLI